jgi:hypothetical protein
MIQTLFNNSLFVMMKVAKPAAVVKLVIKVAVPTLVITRCKTARLYFHEQRILLVFIGKKNTVWYSITITSVSTRAVRTVILME